MAAADSFVFDIASLEHFDDAVTKDFNLQLQGIVQDCRKRPSCNKARAITLKVEAVPSEHDPDDVVLTCVVSSKIPAAKHVAKRARVSRTNQLQMRFDQEPESDDDDYR